MTEEDNKIEALRHTSKIVAAHVSNNSVPPGELSELITRVFHSLSRLGQPESAAPEQRAPAVPVKKSVFPDYLICLEDGKRMKMLKRHLRTSYNLTPEEYRLRWGLPDDYPMVAPNYTKQRSTLAKAIGLGTDRTKTGAKGRAK